MNLQTAIDRVSLEEAVALAAALDGKTDILEMGTSLVKDYGNLAIEKIREVLTTSTLLVDSKTIDEGAYEFQQAYRFGADIVTAMGAASYDTLAACYAVSQAQDKTMMIDLLEVNEEKMHQIADFEQAIYALHHSVDRKDKQDTVASVAEFHQKFPQIKRLAIAGGIDLTQAQALAKQGLIEIVIVGSKITKAAEPIQAATQFMEGIQS
ncbi:3-hexulose-6-phosphate synthase [Enterococcus florum]|uniref:3-hexulose-6-phosphate synthase n=1 Tax=Enterococcus florum TaxID=2480627 RepID=A0A4P5PFI2_9ENTE|nr:orotidine 5'-phosphate decarboxylase / HUMPS family protein [Enterococcus florum]GCF95008.1 3-hexulose-6-phosphate synthase [Enterococcus florum]